MFYYYDNILEVPTLGITDDDGNLIAGVHYDLEQNINMPNCVDCSWNLNDSFQLIVQFDEELSENQKEILDSIIVNNS